MEVGLKTTAEMANVVALQLPRFASRVGYDPRAPQNVLPIGALEKRLRHLLGDGPLVRRHIEVHIARSNAVAASLEAMGV